MSSEDQAKVLGTGQLIAIVEDEPDILELVAHHIQKAGFAVETFSHPSGFQKFLEHTVPDLVVLDLMLPGMDGLEICRSLRSQESFASIPIIILSARGSEADLILGLELGADDYVPKPFSPRELVARIRAVLRRFGQVGERSVRGGELLDINSGKFEVRVNNRQIDLTTTEFKILNLLASRPGWVFSRETMLNRLWDGQKAVCDRTIDVHVKNLRSKLGPAGHLVVNVRGVGYKLKADGE